jgi:hypothetical protein
MPDLNFDRSIQLNAENDKNTSMQIGVWNGNASLTVFSNRQVVVKVPMNRFFQVSLKQALDVLLSAGKPGDKRSWNFTKYDPDTKKSNPLASVFVGRDDKALFYVGITSPGHSPMKFPIRLSMGMDTGTPMTEVERSELAAVTIAQQLHFDIPLQASLTNFKRTDMRGRDGGNAGGGSLANEPGITMF